MFAILILTSLAAIASAAPANSSTFKQGEAIINASASRSLLTLEDGSVNIQVLLTSTARTLSRYVFNPRYLHSEKDTWQPLSLRRRQFVGGIAQLQDCVIEGVDTGYAVEMTVAKQRDEIFDMLIDTGSADLVVPGPKCGIAQGCNTSVKYEESGRSIDNGQMVEIEYNVDSGNGTLFTDNIEIAGLSVPDQTILSLITSDGLGTQQFGGVLGMGGQELSVSNSTTFFQNLMSHKSVGTPEFGVFLGRSTSGTGPKSNLVLGGYDTGKVIGNLYNIPVNNASGWVVPVDYVEVNGKAIGPGPLFGKASPKYSSGGLATIDTGSTLMITSKSNADAIFAEIPGSQAVTIGSLSDGSVATENYTTNDASNNQSSYYAIPCRLSSTISTTYMPKFVFSTTGDVAGGSVASATPPLPVDFRDFNLGTVAKAAASSQGTTCDLNTQAISLAAQGEMCLASIMGSAEGFDPSQGESLYVLGDAWLKGWYSIYQYDGNGKPYSVTFGKTR